MEHISDNAKLMVLRNMSVVGNERSIIVSELVSNVLVGDSSCPSYIPGLYSSEEIDKLIFDDGWIPVASAKELDLIRTGLLEVMGLGTCWESLYTTGGISKRYIQVSVIDFSTVPTWTTQIDFLLGSSYDGNELGINNLVSTNALFQSVTSEGYFDNIRINNATHNSTLGVASILISTTRGGRVNNCQVSGTMAANDVCGMIIGRINAIGSMSVTDCTNYADYTLGNVQVGGVIGECLGSFGSVTVRVDNCVNYGNILGGNRSSGIVGGVTDYSTIFSCVNYGTIESDRAGGIFSIIKNVLVKNCINHGTIRPISTRAGGLGFRLGTAGARIDYSYSTGLVTSFSAQIGGLVGSNNGNIFDSYWDINTSGQVVSAGGSPKTTVDLQSPVSNTGIYVAWTIPPWFFGTSSEYPILTS